MLIYLIGLGLVFCLGGVGVWLLCIKGQTPQRVTGKTPDVPYEEVTFISNKATLKGWFIPAPNHRDIEVNNGEFRSPLIILAHGWSSSKSRMLRYVMPLHQAGYALLLFDSRSHGESDGIKAPSAKSFREDVIAAVKYAKTRKEIDPERIGILGHSFGAFGTLFALKNDIGVKAVVTDSMPVRFRTIMEVSLSQYKLPYYPLGPILMKLMFFRARLTAQELRDNFDLPLIFKQRTAPVFMVHSKNDNYVPSTELDYLLASQHDSDEQVEYLYVESKGHRSSETDPRFWKQVIPFFEKHV